MRRRQRKPKGRKKVAYELIDRESIVGRPVYQLLNELIDAHHEHLADARVALAWALTWRPDRDGRVKLGMCKKASDLDRELSAYDFIILLKKSFWYHESTKKEHRRALLDHELCHAGVVIDERTGEPVYDERGRKCFRVIRHDLEEFSAVVERHGTWKRDIEQFAAALDRSAAVTPWQPCEACRDTTTPGWVEVEDERGVKRQARCECVKTWQERRAEAVSA